MRLQRDVYRAGFCQSEEPLEVAHGLVEVIYKNGMVAEIEVDEVDSVIIHHRIPDGVAIERADPFVLAAQLLSTDYCKECGANYPLAARTVEGPWHETSCSAHVDRD